VRAQKRQGCRQQDARSDDDDDRVALHPTGQPPEEPVVAAGRSGCDLAPPHADSAGTKLSPTASATNTVAMPPIASEVNVGSPNANSPASEAITITAEKLIVRPAVPTVRATATPSSPSGSAPRSSRNRLTISRL
jgi:hypothetical protein